MEEESWRRNHGGIMEEESGRRKRGGKIMGEQSWRMIIEEDAGKGNHEPCGIMEED